MSGYSIVVRPGSMGGWDVVIGRNGNYIQAFRWDTRDEADQFAAEQSRILGVTQ